MLFQKPLPRQGLIFFYISRRVGRMPKGNSMFDGFIRRSRLSIFKASWGVSRTDRGAPLARLFNKKRRASPAETPLPMKAAENA